MHRKPAARPFITAGCTCRRFHQYGICPNSRIWHMYSIANPWLRTGPHPPYHSVNRAPDHPNIKLEKQSADGPTFRPTDGHTHRHTTIRTYKDQTHYYMGKHKYFFNSNGFIRVFTQTQHIFQWIIQGERLPELHNFRTNITGWHGNPYLTETDLRCWSWGWRNWRWRWTYVLQ